MNENINTLSTNLERIKNATDNIRTTLELTSGDVIEDVATAVSDLQAENERLAYELEHCEDIVFNTYYNINLEDTESWRDMQKAPIPFKVNGFKNLAHYFEGYPAGSIKIIGTFGQPTSLECFMQDAHFTSIDIPKIDTSKVTNFSSCFRGCYIKNEHAFSMIQNIIDDGDTSSGEQFDFMFGGLTGEGQDVTLDVSHFDVSSATNLNYMFSGFGYTCTGYEDWDVSHVDGFASMFYGFHGGEDHVIDLSHGYNNKEGDLNLSECFLYAGSTHEILMPNIDNSLRNNTYMSRMFEGCSGCVLIDIRKLILSENDLYRCFYDVNPFCVIVVKDNTEKQKVLNSYPNFKQVYTAAEYEENDHLYSHVHVTLYDRSGNLIPEYDGGAHYSLYYYEYYNNDTNSGEQITSQREYYNDNEIILPMNSTYRVNGYYDGYGATSEEFTLDNTETEIEGIAGPYYYTITVNARDNDSHNLIDKELHLGVGEWGDMEDYGAFTGGTTSFLRRQDRYTRIEVRDEDGGYYNGWSSSFYAYSDRTCDVNLSPYRVQATLTFKYDNDTLVEPYVLTDQYRLQIGSDTYRNFSNNPAEFYTSYSWPHIYYDGDSFEVVLSKRNTQTGEGEEVNSWTVDKNIGGPQFVPDDIIIGEAPEYANITVNVRDGFTNQLLSSDLVSQNHVVNFNSYTNSYIYGAGENPITKNVVAGMNYSAYADGEGYDSGWCSTTVTPQPNENITLNVYVYPEITLTFNYVDQEGHNINDRYGQICVNFCKNGEILSSWENWTGTQIGGTGLISTRDRDMTCDSLQVYFYDDTDDLIYTSAPIPYTDGVLQYNATISNTNPSPYTTITFNFKDEDTHELIPDSPNGYVWIAYRDINGNQYGERNYWRSDSAYENPLTIKVPNNVYGHDIDIVRVNCESFYDYYNWYSEGDGRDLYKADIDYTKGTTNTIDIYLRRV